MSSKAQVLSNNVNSFPNNNSGQITPQVLRDFNADFINSVQFTDTPTPVAVSASFAQNAATATSASLAANATSASFALTASFALNANTSVNTGSLLTDASAVNATTTFTRGNGTTFDVTVDNVVNADTASNTPNALVNAVGGVGNITFTKGDGTTFPVVVAVSGSVATSSLALNSERLGGVLPSGYVTTAATSSFATKTELNAYTASTNTFTASIQTQVNALQAATSSYVRNAQTSSMSVLSASFATTASFASTAAQATSASFATNAASAATATSASFATTAGVALTVQNGLNISASNITVANNLVVNGTASFAYTKTTTGSAVTIGDEFIILNADTPTAPFAGIMVYDTGSASTASLEWNGNADYWIVVEEGGQSAGILTGATGSKGSETFPTTNRLVKGVGDHQIVNSNISDNGSVVSINSNTQVTGSLSTTGDINIAQTGKLVVHDIQAAAVNGLEILNNTSGAVALFGAGGSTGMTVYGQVNATAFSGSGALVTGVVSSSYAVSASQAQNAVTANSATTATSASFATTASFAVSASWAPQQTFDTGSFATTGSNTFTGFNTFEDGIAVNQIAAQNAGIDGPDITITPYSIGYLVVGGSGIKVDDGIIATGSISALGGFTGSLQGTASFATSASFAPQTPAFPFTGSAQITGSLSVSGSIFTKPTYVTTERSFSILEAADDFSRNGNVILTRSQLATSTGSVAITGSNLFIALSNGAGNTFVNGGGASIIRGINSIVLGNSVPTITGSNGSGYNRTGPLFSNSINMGSLSLTDNRTSTSPTFFNTTNTMINGVVSATISTGSLSINNSNVNASLALTVTGSNGAAKSILNTIIGGGAKVDFVSSGSMSIQNGVIAGSSMTASLVDGASSMLGVIMLGNGLSASGSLGTTATGGSAYVGRWNTLDSTSQVANTAFAVGTGTAEASRRTSLHVSSSGLTTISDLNATGSLQGTASFATTATSASFATTASYALNAGGVQANEVYSYSFLTMGA